MDQSMTHVSSITELCFYRGRVGLYALLKALDIGAGDQVALQAFTCLAVPEAVLASGAAPVYIDISDNGFNMDAVDLKKKLTPQIRAIVVQHTFGIPADMDRVTTVTAANGIPIIEDCCHTLVSKYKGREVGSFGVGSFYSYEWGKPVVAGIGGSLRINDPEIREKVLKDYSNYRSPGLVTQVKTELQYQAFRLLYRPALYWPVRDLFHRLGSLGLAKSNYNPVEQGKVADDFSFRMAPAIKRRLNKKLRNIERFTSHSRWVSEQYRHRIRSDDIRHPVIPEECDTVFARYPLLLKDKQNVLLKARQAGVELAEWYATPVHPLMDVKLRAVHYTPGSCPNAEARCREVVTLPTHSVVTQHDIEKAVKFLNKAF